MRKQVDELFPGYVEFKRPGFEYIPVEEEE